MREAQCVEDPIIDKRIRDVERVIEIYEDDVIETLKKVCGKIKVILKETLDDNASENELILENSVYKDLYLYDISDRVKNPESLKHKLISKNILKDIDIENDDVKNELYGIDDIIGIKILTNLSKDRNSVLNVFKNNENELLSKSIKLSRDDIENMPEEMKNGREIYKIKGIFKEVYKFELQIKSKIDSVWGDLEHNLFYKDYDFNYIKDNNKKIMNNIGDLLEQIENLLSTVRESKSKFDEDFNLMKIKNVINDKYLSYIEQKFKTKSIFETYLYLICSIYKDMNDNCEKIIDIEHLKEISDINLIYLEENNKLIKNFNAMKKDNIHLAMIEIIFKGMVDIEDSNDVIEMMIKYILRFNIMESRKKLLLEQSDELVNEICEPIINIIKNYEIPQINSNIFLDNIFMQSYINLKNKIYEKIEDDIIEDIIDDEEDQENLKIIINNILIKYILSNEIEKAGTEVLITIITSVKDDIATILKNKEISKDIEKINQESFKILRDIEQKMKEGELDE